MAASSSSRVSAWTIWSVSIIATSVFSIPFLVAIHSANKSIQRRSAPAGG